MSKHRKPKLEHIQVLTQSRSSIFYCNYWPDSKSQILTHWIKGWLSRLMGWLKPSQVQLCPRAAVRGNRRVSQQSKWDPEETFTETSYCNKTAKMMWVNWCEWIDSGKKLLSSCKTEITMRFNPKPKTWSTGRKEGKVSAAQLELEVWGFQQKGKGEKRIRWNCVYWGL